MFLKSELDILLYFHVTNALTHKMQKLQTGGPAWKCACAPGGMLPKCLSSWAGLKLAQIVIKQRDAKTPQIHMFWQRKLILYTVFCLFVLLTLVNAVFVREPSLFLETRSQINEEMGKIMKDEDLLYSHFGRWSGSWVMVK